MQNIFVEQSVIRRFWARKSPVVMCSVLTIHFRIRSVSSNTNLSTNISHLRVSFVLFDPTKLTNNFIIIHWFWNKIYQLSIAIYIICGQILINSLLAHTHRKVLMHIYIKMMMEYCCSLSLFAGILSTGCKIVKTWRELFCHLISSTFLTANKQTSKLINFTHELFFSN